MNEEAIQVLSSIIDYAQKGINILQGNSYVKEAKNYFDACGDSLTQINKDSWNTFVVNTQKTGHYQKLFHALPFLGGNPVSHTIDAITCKPIIKWVGNGTHNGSGFRGDGKTGYGEFLIDLSKFDSTNIHFGFYNRTSFAEDNGGQNTAFDFGCGNATGNQQCKMYVASQNFFRAAIGNGFIEASFGGYGKLDEELGWALAIRRSPIDLEISRNAVIKAANQVAADKTPFLSIPPYLGAFNNNGALFAPTIRQYALWHMGYSFTGHEVVTLLPHVERFEKENNRGVL